MKRIRIATAVGLTMLAIPAFADPVKISGNVTDVFGSRFVVDSTTGKYLVDVGPKGLTKFTIKSGDKIDIEGNAQSREVHARRVTLADGHAYELGRKRGSWTSWLLGKPSTPPVAFTGETAKKLASDKGYTVTSDPVADRKTFKVMATIAGNKFELDIHRDGRIIEQRPFDVDDAKKQATAKGYALTGDPKLLLKHFRAQATKDGKPYELDIHRDGRIEAMTPFGMSEAKSLAVGKGYELVGEPRAVDEHFELLAKKDAKFYELRAHRSGRLERARTVEANDAKWKSVIR